MPPGAFRNPFAHSPQPARIVAVIPARYASTRLPGKPLADIAGHPMIEHVYRRAARAPGVDAVVVVTDDERIARAVERFGGIARMTGAHDTGTDRIAELAREMPCEILVNVQGDLPLVEPAMIAEVIAPMTAENRVPMATLRRAIADTAEYHSPHVVKVVVDRRGDALYFSRAPIPFVRTAAAAGAGPWKHIGLYAYRREFLLTLSALPRTPLEQIESLEQLRALEHGYRIRTAETQHESIEVDTPEDLERVRRTLAAPAGA